MKRLIFAGLLVLITTAAQAQAYATLDPTGAGGYRSGVQRDIYRATGNPGKFRSRHTNLYRKRSMRSSRSARSSLS
jgi:hypothetical protein